MRPLLGGIGEAFEDSNFRRYSLGSVLSWISYFAQAVAVSWTTWSLTHSTRWLAFLGLIASIACLALAWTLLTGVIAMVAVGASYELCRTGSVTLLQTSIPDAVRGRA